MAHPQRLPLLLFIVKPFISLHTPTMSFISHCVLSTGILLLIHAAYSLQHYRSLVHNTFLETTTTPDLAATAATPSIPLDIRIELGLSLLFLLSHELFRVALVPVVATGGGAARSSSFLPPPHVSRLFDTYQDRARGFAEMKTR